MGYGAIDISGKQFGRLLAVTGVGSRGGRALWWCKCDCGGEAIVEGHALRSGKTRSCGCLAKEWSSYMGANPNFTAIRIAKQVRHGHRRIGGASPEYKTWLGIKRRCYAPSCKDYPNWGGRGIRVCDRWNTSFEAFLADMGQKPRGYSIDRLDPDGDYGPDNCRWAPQSEQGALNRRGLRAVTLDGRGYPSLRALARDRSLNYSTLMMRLSSGYSLEEAVTATRADLAKRRSKESYLPRNHPKRANQARASAPSSE